MVETLFGRAPAVVVLVIFVAGGAAPSLHAQEGYGVAYRPSDIEYRVHSEGPFDLIYQVGAEDMAWRTKRALEQSWAGTDSLVGGSDVSMPVVINNYNDRSNGFVSPFPFRQEIEAPSIKADELVARASTWPALVAPHELVHAAHAEIQGGVGVGAVVRLFAPDVARGINLLAPSGLVEGVAVYRESHVESGMGRLNEPLFTMKMKAAMMAGNPWSFTQMMEPPSYTQPFNRHYIGGGHAFQYLAERGDSVQTDFFEETTTWHNRFPFLGHGVWLGLSTGEWPTELGADIQTHFRSQYRAALQQRKPFTTATMIAGEKGRNHRRPYWLDEETLVTYMYGYDVRPGFYRIDAETGRHTRIRVQEITEDRTYSLGPDTTALFASRYVQDPFVTDQEIAEVERVDLSSGQATRLTTNGRSFVPAQTEGGSVFVATNEGAFSSLARVVEESPVPVAAQGPSNVRKIAPAPRDSTLAVLLKGAGTQRVYRYREGASQAELEPWFGVEDAVIYDVSWGPQGRYLLFSADLSETVNVFAYDTATDRVLRLTNARFGAFEPALSPDRSTLAYVNYRHERHDLVRIPFRPRSAPVLPDSLLLSARDAEIEFGSTEGSSERFSQSNTHSYAAWRHLDPRMVYPTIHGDNGAIQNPDPSSFETLGVGVGVALAGTDPLRRWAYQANTYWQDGRIWGEVRLQSGQFLLRPSLSIYDRAFTTTVRRQQSPVEVGVEERGGSLGIRLPVILQSNVYHSALRFRLNTEIRQVRLFGSPLERPTPFSTRLTFSPQAEVGYRLQRNPRDVVPNTGIRLQMLGEIDAWTDGAAPSKAFLTRLDAYVPLLRTYHTGIRLGAQLLSQNRGSIFGTRRVVPRGHSGLALSGTYLGGEVEVTQPLWYIDDGLSLIPIYAKVFSVYGYAETLGRIRSLGWREEMSSLGGGISLEARFFYAFNLDLRLGFAYRPGPNDVVSVYRW